MNVTGISNNLEKPRKKNVGNCRICGQPMSMIEDTNIIVCVNPGCKGLKNKHKDDLYFPSFRLYNTGRNGQVYVKGEGARI